MQKKKQSVFDEFLHRSAKNHSVRSDTPQIRWFQIGQDDNHSILHLFDRNKVNETTDDGTRSIFFSQIDFLHIQTVGIGMFGNLNDFSYANVEPRWVDLRVRWGWLFVWLGQRNEPDGLGIEKKARKNAQSDYILFEGAGYALALKLLSFWSDENSLRIGSNNLLT